MGRQRHLLRMRHGRGRRNRDADRHALRGRRIRERNRLIRCDLRPVVQGDGHPEGPRPRTMRPLRTPQGQRCRRTQIESPPYAHPAVGLDRARIVGHGDRQGDFFGVRHGRIRGNRNGQFGIATDGKAQAAEKVLIPVIGRNAQVIPAQVQPCQAGEVAQFGGDRPTQVVVAQVQRPQVGEVAQFGGDRPAQIVVEQEQIHQVGVAQFGGD